MGRIFLYIKKELILQSDTSSPSNSLIILVVTVMTIALNCESSLYIQNIPELVKYFNVELSDAGYIVRFSFAGTVLFGILVGPLADSYGRKQILVAGVLLYIISNSLCYFVTDFYVFLGLRFLDGVARSVPVIVCWLIVFDKKSPISSIKDVNFVQGIASAVTIFIPFIAYQASKYIDWRLTLLFSSCLAACAFFIIVAGVDETLHTEQRKKFSLKEIIGNYTKLVKNFQFMILIIIYGFASLNYNVFFTNASLIFKEDMGVSREVYSFYQSLNNITYILFSFVGIKIVARKGIDFAKNLGLLFNIIGCYALFIVVLLNDKNVDGMFMSILITAAGAAMMSGFMLKAVALVPDMKGTAMTLSSCVTLLISARGNFWSQEFFNDSLIPPITVIFIASNLAGLMFLYLHFRKKSA